MIHHVAIIPARAGSKSIANKNLQKLGTKSLVQIALEQAKAVNIFERVILTTDIPILIEEHAESDWLDVRQRPDELSSDTALAKDVILDCIYHYKIKPNRYFWYLQPTSPFRTKEDFELIQDTVETGNAKSVISIVGVGQFHPARMYHVKHNKLYPIGKSNFDNKQDLPENYIRNGAFYVAEVGAFLKYQDFELFPVVPHLMPRERSINIDEPMDLIMAQAIASKVGHR
jgi:CMP-N-acetylneuraminic acid synthetase